MGQVTQIVSELEQEGEYRSSDLFTQLYNELRHLAAQKLALERPGQTLQPTALVHEAWLRLARPGQAQWDGRNHFFAAAAEAMRRILIDTARRKKRRKHGGGLRRVDLEEAELPCAMPSHDLLALDEALAQLERLDPTGAQVVKLRFFAGLTHPQIAESLGVSLTTIEREWAFSRAWLFDQMRGKGRNGNS
jgi:RNA polymerase sigma factor (TIGR02999 family)